MRQIEHIASGYIHLLTDNHRFGAGEETKALITQKDYKEMIEPVIHLINEHSEQSTVFFRQYLKNKSPLENNIKQMIYQQRIASGAVVAYGTSEFVDTISTGIVEEGKDKEISDTSVFDLSSLSKLFTAIATLCLYQDGYLELDRDLQEYDKHFGKLRNITIRQLMSFQRNIKTPVRLTADMSIDEANRIIHASYDDTKADSINFYSDIPYMVLRYVLEAATQTSLFDLVKHYILKPLGMTNTVITIPREWLSYIVSNDGEYYIFNDENPILHRTPLGVVNDDKARIFASYGQFAGHAGLFSTVKDMHKFIQAFFDKKLLSWEMLNEIGINRTGKQLDDGRYRQYFGYGCYSKNPYAKASEVYHPLSGNAIAMSGFTGNHISIDVRNHVFIIIVANRCHNRVSKIINSPLALAAIQEESGQSMLRYKSCQNVYTSHRYVYQKDEMLRDPALKLALQNRVIDLIQK